MLNAKIHGKKANYVLVNIKKGTTCEQAVPLEHWWQVRLQDVADGADGRTGDMVLV